MHKHNQLRAFTIVELLIVIVIIAILAAIAIVLYNGIQERAVETTLKGDLRNAANKVALSKAEKGNYPTDEEEALALFTPTPGTNYQYSSADGSSYYLSITSDKAGAPAFCQSSNGSVTEGVCPGHTVPSGPPAVNGALMQTISTGNCPTTRIMAVDARDNRTYWVQKLGGGKWWMLTNLAYGGGGTNTYGDVRTIDYATSGKTFFTPRYYVHAGANPTTNPTSPSTSTDGGATGTQYGYLYNWCGAMGGQSLACVDNDLGPVPDMGTSACPAGWRLPVGGSGGGEFIALNAVINGGSTTTDAGWRSTWLHQLGGSWDNGFGGSQGGGALYWTSTRRIGGAGADGLNLGPTWLLIGNQGYENRMALSVRCLAM